MARLSPPAAAVIESWQPGGLDAEQRTALAVVNHICEDQSDGLRHEKQWVLTQVGQKIVPHLRGSAAAANRLRLIASRNDATPPRVRRMLDGCAGHGSEPACGGVGAAGAGHLSGVDAVRSRGQCHRGGRWAVQISSSAGRRRVRRRDRRDGDCAVLGRRRDSAGRTWRAAVCPARSCGCRELACTEEAGRLGALVDPVRPAGGSFEQPTEFTSVRLLPPAAAPEAPSGCGVSRAGFTA